jgi:hypothetical protein
LWLFIAKWWPPNAKAPPSVSLYLTRHLTSKTTEPTLARAILMARDLLTLVGERWLDELGVKTSLTFDDSIISLFSDLLLGWNQASNEP